MKLYEKRKQPFDAAIQFTNDRGSGLLAVESASAERLITFIDNVYQAINVPGRYVLRVDGANYKTGRQLFKAIIETACFEKKSQVYQQWDVLTKQLLARVHAGEFTTILVDNAHTLCVDQMETLKAIWNVNSEQGFVAQIIVAGDAVKMSKTVNRCPSFESRIEKWLHLDYTAELCAVKAQ